MHFSVRKFYGVNHLWAKPARPPNSWLAYSGLTLMTKTKEMIVDFRRQEHSPGKTIIHNNEVEIVSKHKYPDTIFDDKLKWDDNAEEIVKKGQQRLCLLRKLNYFSADQKILTLFYKSFIESVLSFSFTCWFHCLGVKNRNSLQRIVRIASKITAMPQRDLALFCEQQILRKARSILTKKDHILNREFTTLPSGRRLTCPTCKTNRFKNSFTPVALCLFNNT